MSPMQCRKDAAHQRSHQDPHPPFCADHYQPPPFWVESAHYRRSQRCVHAPRRQDGRRGRPHRDSRLGGCCGRHYAPAVQFVVRVHDVPSCSCGYLQRRAPPTRTRALTTSSLGPSNSRPRRRRRSSLVSAAPAGSPSCGSRTSSHATIPQHESSASLAR
jgi:hypothetical protein